MSTEVQSSLQQRFSLDERLEHGPLQVKTLWDDTSTAALPRKTLERRRRQFVLKSVAVGAMIGAAGFQRLVRLGAKLATRG